jgi:hypothetical protein
MERKDTQALVLEMLGWDWEYRRIVMEIYTSDMI